MKVKINPVVKYDWEQQRYVGNLIAVHLNRIHVAYVLRGSDNFSSFFSHFILCSCNVAIFVVSVEEYVLSIGLWNLLFPVAGCPKVVTS